MRNLQECQAEIFRRSEERIRRRRQRRKRVLLASVPMVLLAGLFVLPSVVPAVLETPDCVAGLTNESAVCTVAKIEVSGPGVSLSYTQPSDILLISNLLYSYEEYNYQSNGTAMGETAGEIDWQYTDGTASHVIDTTSAPGGYTITLTSHTGGITAFYLTGSTLKNHSACQTYRLTKDQLKEIKDILGIPQS